MTDKPAATPIAEQLNSMLFTAVPTPQCPYCGSWPHQQVEQCPAIQKIEYYPDGTIKSVEKK